MTIAIGLISKSKEFGDKGRIVLASDSQTTYPGGQKRLDAQKINVINFANAEILVAQSGSAELADKAVEILKRNAAMVAVDNADTIPKTVQSAVREVRNYLVDLNQGCNFTDDAWKRFFRDENAFTLLWGYYFNGNPYLYTISIDWCLSLPVNNNFKAIGCGAALAEFLLKEFGEASPDFDFPDIIATAVVEKVIENIEGCGRPSWVGMVQHVLDCVAASDLPGYKKGDVIPADKRCESFICRRRLTDAIADGLKLQEKRSKSKNSKQLRDYVFSLCKKIGPLIYTDIDDPKGSKSIRMSAHFKKKDQGRVFKKLRQFTKSKQKSFEEKKQP